jgi:hypothetical protein
MPALALLAALVLAQAGPGPVQVNGYLGTRAGLTLGWPDDPSAPALSRLFGIPDRSLLTEANIQLRVKLHEGWDLFSDLSLFVNAQGGASGAAGSVPAMGNLAEPSELYLNMGFADHLNGLVGRKRLVWGSGFVWNPADQLNPPKDPTDPSLQRAGAWLVRAEAPFEKVTLTALWAPKVTATDAGLPRRFLYAPGSDHAQQLFAARIYALVEKADVNLMWFWSDRYADAVPHSHRFGLSFSRYFFTDYELHFEALVQRGREATLFHPECLPVPDGSSSPPLACAAAGRSSVEQPFLDNKAAYAKIIAGTRYTFSDDTLISAEYYFDGTGLDGARFDDRQHFLDRLPDVLALPMTPAARARIPDPANVLGLADAGNALPVRLSFQTLRRHYLFLVFQKPKIRDDFTFNATLVLGLEDPSAVLAPGLTWSAREWLSLALFGYLPLGSATSEYGSLPFRARGLFEMKAYY